MASTIAAPLSFDRHSSAERRALIIDAFERCIVRAGFHRTTMQDVAGEAGMSAGNLYRYFASKEALVSGLAERDRERFTAEFEQCDAAGDLVEALKAVGRKHLVEEPSSRCIQFLEIWAEATRNPAVATVCREKEAQVREHIVNVFQAAQQAGQISSGVDLKALTLVIVALTDGFFMRRAVDESFDSNEAFRLVTTVVDAALKGQLDLSAGPFQTEDKIAGSSVCP